MLIKHWKVSALVHPSGLVYWWTDVMMRLETVNWLQSWTCTSLLYSTPYMCESHELKSFWPPWHAWGCDSSLTLRSLFSVAMQDCRGTQWLSHCSVLRLCAGVLSEKQGSHKRVMISCTTNMCWSSYFFHNLHGHFEWVINILFGLLHVFLLINA